MINQALAVLYPRIRQDRASCRDTAIADLISAYLVRKWVVNGQRAALIARRWATGKNRGRGWSARPQTDPHFVLTSRDSGSYQQPAASTRFLPLARLVRK